LGYLAEYLQKQAQQPVPKRPGTGGVDYQSYVPGFWDYMGFGAPQRSAKELQAEADWLSKPPIKDVASRQQEKELGRTVRGIQEVAAPHFAQSRSAAEATSKAKKAGHEYVQQQIEAHKGPGGTQAEPYIEGVGRAAKMHTALPAHISRQRLGVKPLTSEEIAPEIIKEKSGMFGIGSSAVGPGDF